MVCFDIKIGEGIILGDVSFLRIFKHKGNECSPAFSKGFFA